MSGILSICALVLLAIAAGVAIYGIFGLIFGNSEDLKSAGVYRGKLDLSEVYRDPIGFEPHGSRDTFVPTEVDRMSTDDFIEALRHSVEDGIWLGNSRMHQQMKRAYSMLVEAREIMDDISIIDDELSVSHRAENWLVRGHQD